MMVGMKKVQLKIKLEFIDGLLPVVINELMQLQSFKILDKSYDYIYRVYR